MSEKIKCETCKGEGTRFIGKYEDYTDEIMCETCNGTGEIKETK